MAEKFSQSTAKNLLKLVNPLDFVSFPISITQLIAYVPVGFQLTAVNARPEHWEHSEVKGFDEAYRKAMKLVEYENQAFQEAGWKMTEDFSGGGGPNIYAMLVSVCVLTFMCFSFLALIALT